MPSIFSIRHVLKTHLFPAICRRLLPEPHSSDIFKKEIIKLNLSFTKHIRSSHAKHTLSPIPYKEIR